MPIGQQETNAVLRRRTDAVTARPGRNHLACGAGAADLRRSGPPLVGATILPSPATILLTLMVVMVQPRSFLLLQTAKSPRSPAGLRALSHAFEVEIDDHQVCIGADRVHAFSRGDTPRQRAPGRAWCAERNPVERAAQPLKRSSAAAGAGAERRGTGARKMKPCLRSLGGGVRATSCQCPEPRPLNLPEPLPTAW